MIPCKSSPRAKPSWYICILPEGILPEGVESIEVPFINKANPNSYRSDITHFKNGEKYYGLFDHENLFLCRTSLDQVTVLHFDVNVKKEYFIPIDEYRNQKIDQILNG